jgi:hypothetical protein
MSLPWKSIEFEWELKQSFRFQHKLSNKDDQNTTGRIIGHLTANTEVRRTVIKQNRFQQSAVEYPAADETDEIRKFDFPEKLPDEGDLLNSLQFRSRSKWQPFERRPVSKAARIDHINGGSKNTRFSDSFERNIRPGVSKSSSLKDK